MKRASSQPPSDDLPLWEQKNMVEPPAAPGTNAPPCSVGDLSRQIRRAIETGFSFVRVRGEIGACKLAASGHLYLSLKDDTAVLDAVCWRGQAGKLGIRPEMGMDVVVTGKLTTYFAGASRYQLVIESMALAGEGALLKLLEERKRKLAAEGLFDAARKKALPYLPEVIGVITSPSGAVIRDILHRLADRFPRRVLVWPVLVQGEGAAAQVAAALAGFNALAVGGAVPRPDLLIVARGGGSLEDLMPFNEEIVVRAVAASAIPVISAVGHETDTTLCDFAADLRAPTPTAAAEMAVPVRSELRSQIKQDGLRLDQALRRVLSERQERLRLLGRALGDPMRVLHPLAQRLDERAERFALAMGGFIERARARLQASAGRLRDPKESVQLARQKLGTLSVRMEGAWLARRTAAEKRLDRAGGMLSALSPRAVLGRGYALVYDSSGHVVMRADALSHGDQVGIEFASGRRNARIDD